MKTYTFSFLRTMFIKKTIWLVLLIFTAACASAQSGEVAQTATMTPSSVPLVLPSSTPSRLPPTPSSTPTSSPSPSPTTPVVTPTQTPLERIAFITEVTECWYVCDSTISFVNSDGTGLESSTLVEPFYNSQGYLAWSPDGRFLAFDGADTITDCDLPGTECNTTNYGTYVADYSQRAILQHIEGTLTNASWSPDGQHLVLSIRDKSANRRSIGDLYILDVKSGRLRQLTSSSSSHLYPSWSPDGQWVAFLRFDPDIPGCSSMPSIDFENEKCNQASLYRIRPDGSDLQLLFEPVFIFRKPNWMGDISNAPAWSPDSRWLAFLTKNENGLHDQSDISIVNVETGERQLVVRVSGFEVAITPAWSPDGQQLAFALDRHGNFDIFLWDMKENSIVNLTETPTNEYTPVWSLSGAHIACISLYDLLIMNADGTNRVLIDDEGLGLTRGIPAWQPGVQP